MKYEQLAKDIIENVGGKENIISVVHCITRLRFQLRDEGKAKTDVLKNMEGIVTVMKSGGQYQVVIGNHVPDVYEAVVTIGDLHTSAPEEADSKKKGVFNQFIDVISSIFSPILGVLAATGMIKGLNALFVALGWLSNTSGTYQILNAIGDSLFYFFPIFLGYTASKKFGGNIFIGMAIGASLVYPALSGLTTGKPLYTLFAGTMFESPVHITFLGIPVILMSYASSVIPIIIAAYIGAKAEKTFKKLIPDVVKTFLVPFCTLLLVIPLTFIVIGPIATWAGQLLGQGTIWLYELSPLVAGLFIGGFWQAIVIFGLHWGLVPVAINNLTLLGSDPVLALMFGASFAQIGAVLAVWLKTKQQKLKSLSIPAFISGIFGVTEPAIYGITLPLKKPFIMSCIGGAIGGGILGLAGSKVYMVGGLGIFGIPNFIDPKAGITMAFWGAIIAIIVSFVFGFILTYLFGFDKEKIATTVDEAAATSKEMNRKEVGSQNEKNIITSPFEGKVIQLSSIKDAAFASGALGKGVAIEPSIGKLFAPFSGTVSALFPTNHAIGIVTDYGAELLIHIGMDTVQLGGKHFSSHIAQGDRVEKGQLLIEFDIQAIQAAGYVVTTPVVITNTDKYDVVVAEANPIKISENLIEVISK
ncbi:beta-glucoside-specific PTS transporter subunit IIABC [Bacillus mycoides]|uniref:beta-glucoside-specific PTS transporter subunit IIABC n=1 Tax=Bacillus mycoides TaxID=1405 RepID=UPI002111D751|nr:beta-glucoside-specific PTS transporter subunit IIABC [Bacillus mycoides]MCQ6566879.1 beta-glucoside-specific PTS transporter subunit IIABC [Bacillus mycoides]